MRTLIMLYGTLESRAKPMVAPARRFCIIFLEWARRYWTSGADSDHYWITYSISFRNDDAPLASLVTSKRARYLWNKADWPTFRKRVTQAAASFPWHGDVEQQAAYISSAIRTAAHAAVPSGVPGFKSAWTAGMRRQMVRSTAKY